MEQWQGEIPVDLTTQTADLNFNNAGPRNRVVTPDGLEQHAGRNRLLLVSHKVFEQAELARLERNRLACPLDASCP
jgi:hypothetical protein